MIRLNTPKMTNSTLSLLLLLSLLTLTTADIKTLRISSDSRPLIHLQNFAFSSNGTLSISISDATIPSSLDPSLFGFFLISSPNILQLLRTSPNRCILSSPYIRPLFTLRDLSPSPFTSSYNQSFWIHLPESYTLFFANCAGESDVTMSVHISMFNNLPGGSRDYLPLGESPLPFIYLLFAIPYISFLIFWVHFGLIKNQNLTHRIHFLMAGLLFLKALNLLLESEEKHIIKISGSPHGWDFLFYLFQSFKGVMLFTVIVLIGTGWSFLRPFLHEREKRVLMVVMPLQVVVNVASVVVVEMGPAVEDVGFWIQVMLLVDLVCCCAILFPVVWSIRMLREVGKTDGKARRNLAKLVMFRRFYLVLIGYLYFTRVVVYALETVLSYEYKWVSAVVDEGVTLAFYMLMFYMFRPKERNEYFALGEEEEVEAAKQLKEGLFDI